MKLFSVPGYAVACADARVDGINGFAGTGALTWATIASNQVLRSSVDFPSCKHD
jgi:hypothetical protein